jgi:hypothetical protein
VVLTKQEQALVQAQLDKESVIRQHVASIKASYDRGLKIIRSLIPAGILDFRLFMSSVVPLLLEGALQSVLAGQMAFDTYLVSCSLLDISRVSVTLKQDLAKCCSPRLESFREWIGLAAVRSLEVKVVPEEFQAEPIDCTIVTASTPKLSNLLINLFVSSRTPSSLSTTIVIRTKTIRLGNLFLHLPPTCSGIDSRRRRR